MEPPRQLARLPDGRRLEYAEYGDPGGVPVFHIHGWPSELQQAGVMGEAARSAGVRIIAPNRPGIGRSSPQPGRRIGDFAADLGSLAGSLGIVRFGVIGVSGGGPYALACAHALPGCAAAAVVSGAPPLDSAESRRRIMMPYRWAIAVDEHAPKLARAGFWLAAPALALPVPLVATRALTRTLPDTDRRVLCDPRIGPYYQRAAQAAFRSGGLAVADDGRLYRQPWGFDLKAVAAPVKIWHGSEDPNFHWQLAEVLAARLPGAAFSKLQGEGHFSAAFAAAGDVMAWLKDRV